MHITELTVHRKEAGPKTVRLARENLFPNSHVMHRQWTAGATTGI